MEETPPRRRRPPPRDDGPSLPFIPIVLGVIILGFVIGAGLSVAGRRPPPQDVVPLATATPLAAAPAPTFAPATTPAPPSPSPRARVKPRPRAAVLAPATTASPASALSPSPEPSPAALRQAQGPRVAPSPAETETVAAQTPAPEKATARPSAVTTAAPATPPPAVTAPPPPTPVAVARDDVTSDFGRQAAGVVRAYLAAVARGDTAGAYAQLGTAPDVSATALPETGIVTPATRIVHVEARGGENAVTVNVDMRTPSGAYFGQFTVHRSPNGAAIIVQHSIFKS